MIEDRKLIGRTNTNTSERSGGNVAKIQKIVTPIRSFMENASAMRPVESPNFADYYGALKSPHGCKAELKPNLGRAGRLDTPSDHSDILGIINESFKSLERLEALQTDFCERISKDFVGRISKAREHVAHN